jgi:hypothetical protein
MLMPPRKELLLCSCLFAILTALGNWRGWSRSKFSDRRHGKQVKNCAALGCAYQGSIYA